MVIVSDTSVITNLLRIDHLLLLRQIFGQIIIPPSVRDELYQVKKQIKIINESDWISIKEITNKTLYEELRENLDPGESESIVLALELNADILLLDERKGRRAAEKYGIRITGLLGILMDAKEFGMIEEVKPIMDRLIYEVGFRISPKLYQQVLKRVGEK